MHFLFIQQLLPGLGFILWELRYPSDTLHQKVKYPSEGQIEEISGDQAMARQCMVAAIRHKPEAEPVTLSEKEL